MNPLETSQKIEERLQNYIRSTLPVERSMPDFTKHLDELFKEHRMIQDPYLEMTLPYAKGKSLEQLYKEGVIEKETAEIFSKAYEKSQADFCLYEHQSNAVKSVCKEDKNLIVSSGTGSGKTECFLIPIIDYIVKEWKKAGKPQRMDDKGVYAMILYPMNALVNDQIRRLRDILKHAPFITFGKYTGELQQINDEESIQGNLIDNIQTHKENINRYNKNESSSNMDLDGEIQLPNELTRRSQWVDKPANILVTNYSMLEFLMLKPETSNIFGKNWKYIVLDEAHCYNGALGTEIAWLVRRVKRRLGNPDRLRYLATSATLIKDSKSDSEKEKELIEQFFSRLFPAEKNSFEVEFGKTIKPTIEQNTYRSSNHLPENIFLKLFEHKLTDEEQCKIKELQKKFSISESLFEASQALLGAEKWMNNINKTIKLLF